MVVVPLFLKLVRKQIERKLAALGAARRFAFGVLFALFALLPIRALKRLAFGEIHRQFGGALRHFVCGGAAIDLPTLRFFDRIGLPILQGYGLTETSPVVTANTERAAREGSVGRPLRAVEVHIREEVAGSREGEILIRGPNRMKGYYRREDLTREVVDADGWLHSGDRGRLDRDGFLYITGRIKNLIVLASGKNVQPEQVEAALESPLFDDVCVVGMVLENGGARDGCEEVCAVIVPSEAFKAAHEPAALEDAAREEVARLGRSIADYKRPTRVFVSTTPLPKTATAKVKRKVLAERLLASHGGKA
jgi:long-chain acyl-CoA synthetase